MKKKQQKNKDYWRRRTKRIEDAIKDRAYDYAQNLEKQYERAIREIESKIRAWYQRFAKNNGISYAEAQKWLNAGELKELHWTVQEYIERCKEYGITGAWAKELENASARVHISRLESLKLELRHHAEELAGVQINATTDAAKLAYSESYYHTAFEFQREIGVGWTMHGVDERKLEKLLSRPWTADKLTFTARCWLDKDKLIEAVNQELTRMVATGAAPDKAIENIAKRFKTSKSNAGRVVMTESAYFASAAQKDCYEELDVDEYEIIGTFDGLMCENCGDMDRKVFPRRAFEAGVTAPPFHPWCRCTTAPYFEDMAGVGERFARDPVTGKTYTVPNDMTYEEWKKAQEEKYGEGIIEKTQKMRYNEKTDREQYARYRERLGDDAPKSFEDFQKLKYDEPERWARIKTEFRAGVGLQEPLPYLWNGEKLFVPKNARFEAVKTIAGFGHRDSIRDINRLLASYGGVADDWRKRVARITSDKYVFDVHWYEKNGVQYEMKLKEKKEKKEKKGEKERKGRKDK